MASVSGERVLNFKEDLTKVQSWLIAKIIENENLP